MADDGTKFAWDEEKGDWKQVAGDEEEELEEEEEVSATNYFCRCCYCGCSALMEFRFGHDTGNGMLLWSWFSYCSSMVSANVVVVMMGGVVMFLLVVLLFLLLLFSLFLFFCSFVIVAIVFVVTVFL